MFSTSSRLAPPSGQARRDLLGPERLGERDRGVGRSRVRDIRQHRHGRVAGQEDVVQVAGPVHAIELGAVGAAGGEHGQHERRRLRGIVDPGPGRNHMVRVDVEDELRAGQGLLTRRRVLRRRHVEPAALPRGGRRLRMRGRRRAATGELEGGERRRHRAGSLQESPPVHASPPRRVVDRLPDQRVDLAVLAPAAAGTNSPLETGPAVSGSWSSGRSRWRREKEPMPAMAGRIRPAPARSRRARLAQARAGRRPRPGEHAAHHGLEGRQRLRRVVRVEGDLVPVGREVDTRLVYGLSRYWSRALGSSPRCRA